MKVAMHSYSLFKHIVKVFIIIVITLATHNSFASDSDENTLVIIAHPQSLINALDKKSVSSLYLGRNLEKVEKKIKLYEYHDDVLIKQQFLNAVNGMSIPRYNAYWARLKFSGRQLPPYVISTYDEMLKSIAANTNAIGYLPRKYLNDSVRVILELR